MIDIKSRAYVPKTTISRVCHHCDNPIDVGSKAIRYRGDYMHLDSEATIFCHVVCADAGDEGCARRLVGDTMSPVVRGEVR